MFDITDSSHSKNWIIRAFIIALFDVLIILTSFFAGFVLRFDFAFSNNTASGGRNRNDGCPD